MANPIIPSGQRIIRQIGELDDPVERARRQDEERRIREDDEHFRRTGENRPPITDYSPLVEDNPREDIANDGDSYDEQPLFHQRPNNHTVAGDWAEDDPTEIINPDNQRNRRASGSSQRVMSERESYLRREQEKKDNEQKTLENKNRKKYNNITSGLEAD
jgi:hypothetical protein